MPRRDDPGLPSQPAAAVLPLLLFAAVLAWWAWERGGFFDVKFIPGAMVLLGLLALLLLMAPWPARLHGPARVALVALVGLSVWTLLSALWSPVPAVAIHDAQRVFTYAVAFVLGLWICLLLGRRMLLALGGIAGAGAVVAVFTLIGISISDNPRELLEVDATLRYPIGYRNAEAAFFAIVALPMLVLAASREIDWRLRGALTGTACLSMQIAVLAQSRSSVFAVLVGVAVLVAAHPSRLRMLGWLALAGVPAALALPWLLDVFQTGGGNGPESLPPLHTACKAMAATSLLAGGVGCIAARSDPFVELSERAVTLISRALLGAVAVILVIGAVTLGRAEGGPIGWLDRHTDQLTAGSPDLSSQNSRFGLDLRSERGDFWRVALDDFSSKPLSGEGGGGFRLTYLRERDSLPQPEDPHSVELLMAGELGLPGLALFITFVVAGVMAVIRARRLGPSAAALAAGSLAVGGYWLVHASVEWFWLYPAITMPMAFAIGAAVAPALLHPPRPPRPSRRAALAVGAGLASLLMLPFLLSERYTNDALGTWRDDPDRAYRELDNAADLNPVSDRPLAAEAVIAEAAGDRQRALAALDRAERRVPEEWTLYYLEARVLAPIDTAGATRALQRARELNPRGTEIDQLAQKLGISG